MPRTLQPRLRDEFDWPLFLLVSVVATLGVVNLYSATSAQTGARSELYIQQIYWLGGGALVASLVAIVDYKYYERYAYAGYVANLTALVLVFLVGASIRGTHRWIQIGSFLFQPSEFMKLALMIAVARYISRESRREAWTLRDLVGPGLLIGVPLVLVMAQPDLGTALIIGLVSVSVLCLQRISWRSLAKLLVGGVGGAVFMWEYGLKEYQKGRLTSFLGGERDVQGSGWQAHQSMVAIGSGALDGPGIHARHAESAALPARHAHRLPLPGVGPGAGPRRGRDGARAVSACSSCGPCAWRRWRATASARPSRWASPRSSSGSSSSTSAW
jgi:rod shape determining protein RodA